MQDIQEIFSKLQQAKKDQKAIRSVYRDALSGSAQYKEIVERINELKLKKKEIENAIRSDFSSEFNKLDSLKIEEQGNKAMLSDIALNKLVSGEKVELTDEHNSRYEPVFSVAFKKI